MWIRKDGQRRLRAGDGSSDGSKNQELAKRPELVNSSPYGDGWFFKVKLDKPAEVNDLLSVADYRAQLENRQRSGFNRRRAPP